MDDDEFWELTADLTTPRAEDDAAAAHAVVAAERHRPFLDEARRVQPGEVVSVVLLDGTAWHGRITGVGADWIRLDEVSDAVGAARARTARVHQIREAAVARIVREPGP